MKICPRCSELFTVEGRFCPACGVELVQSTDPYLGRTIAGRYYLTKRLGGGGMATVYLARHVIIERLSAIKILRPDLTLNPSHRERFLREARAVNRINHRNIVEITDYGETEGLVYLVMEYVSGGSLLSYIRDGAFAWTRAARLGMQVASALARAHQAGVIHRDLKPENILVQPPEAAGAPPESELVKLTDFGIAKIVDAPALTFSEQLFGTPGYIAPEYIEGAPASARTDLYALGVCLYEMICAKLPFESRGDMGLLMQPLTQPPIAPNERVRGLRLPADVEELILKLLAKDPAERPCDAFAVHDALGAILRRHGNSASLPAFSVATVAHLPRLGSQRAELQTRDATSVAWPQRGLAEDPSEPSREVSPTPTPWSPEKRETIGTRAGMLARATMKMTNPAAPRVGAWWKPALVELNASIARERARGGPHMLAAEKATELSESAADMAARIARASQAVAGLQLRVDHLDARGREFRADLGRAIDALVHDRSRERADLEKLRAREPADGLGSELARIRAVEEDLTFQIDTLQKQLDSKNEEHDRETLAAAGALEGSLAALRQMMSDLVRMLDDATAIVSHTRR